MCKPNENQNLQYLYHVTMLYPYARILYMYVYSKYIYIYTVYASAYSPLFSSLTSSIARSSLQSGLDCFPQGDSHQPITLSVLQPSEVRQSPGKLML